jgi:hypothetical protein
LFSSQNFLENGTVALFVVIWQLVSDLKDSSREFHLNCVINFIFYLYLMLHACVQKFDVTENLEKLCKILETKQALSLGVNEN